MNMVFPNFRKTGTFWFDGTIPALDKDINAFVHMPSHASHFKAKYSSLPANIWEKHIQKGAIFYLISYVHIVLGVPWTGILQTKQRLSSFSSSFWASLFLF